MMRVMMVRRMPVCIRRRHGAGETPVNSNPDSPVPVSSQRRLKQGYDYSRARPERDRALHPANGVARAMGLLRESERHPMTAGNGAVLNQHPDFVVTMMRLPHVHRLQRHCNVVESLSPGRRQREHQ
jgi:hypothetical protein